MMTSNQKTARMMLDVRIILAVLWVAGMLSPGGGLTLKVSPADAPDVK